MVLRGQTNSNEDEEAIRVCGCRPDLDHKEHRTYVLNSVGQETVLCSPGAVEMRSDFKIISGIEECDRCRWSLSIFIVFSVRPPLSIIDKFVQFLVVSLGLRGEHVFIPKSLSARLAYSRHIYVTYHPTVSMPIFGWYLFFSILFSDVLQIHLHVWVRLRGNSWAQAPLHQYSMLWCDRQNTKILASMPGP